MGYAITSNRIGSSELNENAFKGLALAGSFIFAKDKVYMDLYPKRAVPLRDSSKAQENPYGIEDQASFNLLLISPTLPVALFTN